MPLLLFVPYIIDCLFDNPLRAAAALVLAVSPAAPLYAQIPHQTGGQPHQPDPAYYAQSARTVIQIDTAAVVSAAGAIMLGIGGGMRSAARVMATYLEGRDKKDNEWKAQYGEVVKAIASLVERYHTDRQAMLDTVEEVAEDLDQLAGSLNHDGKGKPHRTPRKRHKTPAQPSADGENNVSKIGDA